MYACKWSRVIRLSNFFNTAWHLSTNLVYNFDFEIIYSAQRHAHKVCHLHDNIRVTGRVKIMEDMQTMIISLTSAVSLFRASLLCHAFSSCLGSSGQSGCQILILSVLYSRQWCRKVGLDSHWSIHLWCSQCPQVERTGCILECCCCCCCCCAEDAPFETFSERALSLTKRFGITRS